MINTKVTNTRIVSNRSSWWAHWPQWVGYFTAAWSFVYGLLGLSWARGGAGFPFGAEHDRAAMESLLVAVRAPSAAPVIAGLGLVAAVVAIAMTRASGHGLSRALLLAFAWVIAVTLMIVIPDRRVLMAVAYAPLFLIGAPFHWPPVSFLVAIPWPVINQFILIVGGTLWAATAVVYQRRSHHACEHCGRIAGDSDQWMSRASALRWGTWAVAVAVIVPVIYAATRWAWALGIPLGISQRFLRAGQATGLWWAGAGLATVAVAGAILTLGLVQRWGEIFPRWMLGIAGKRVPLSLAIVPASIVSIIVTSSGIEDLRISLMATNSFPAQFEVTWSTLGPTVLWPIWGIALAAATYAYYLRRRGQCRYCGQG